MIELSLYQFHFMNLRAHMDLGVSKWCDKGWYEPFFGVEASYFRDFGGGWVYLILPFFSIGFRFSNCLCGCDKNDSRWSIDW